MFLVIFFMYMGQVLAWSTNTNYCSPELCSEGLKHIGCNNTGGFDSSCQPDAKIAPLSQEVICKILDLHNTLRNRVAKGAMKPFLPAARIAKMRWMPELAELATMGVRRCRKRFDPCRNLNILPYVGQSMTFSSWVSKPIPTDILVIGNMNRWIDEHGDGNMENINKYEPPKKGESFTFERFYQMIQEAATHIGCALLLQTRKRSTMQYMVCNYAKANIRGQRVYESSTAPAAGCKTGTDHTYKYLCSVKEVYDWGDKLKTTDNREL